MVTGKGRYTNLDGIEKAHRYLTNNIPGLKARPLKILGAQIGLGATDPELDVALQKHYEWMKKNVGTLRFQQALPQENEQERAATIEFRTGMREGVEQLKKGRDEKALEHFMRAARSGRDVKGSLSSRRILTRIPKRLRGKYVEDMNPRYVDRLAKWDYLLKEWSGVK
jgi:hypothetical protein